jgi:dephospho-CoA kinase
VKTFGITGGIGMGKSTAARILSARGVAVVDADDLARQAVHSGEPALAEIRAAFGVSVLDATGELNREALARIVFTDTSALKKLEAILHPRIQQLWQAQLETWRGEGRAVAAVIIPLLFETGAESGFDTVVCIACTSATQHQRLRARGWTSEQIEQRIVAQMPVTDKMLRANYVVWSEGDLGVLARQFDRILSLTA